MNRHHPRAGLRDRWVDVLVEAEISRPTLLLMLLLAHKMGEQGKVSIRREELAAMLRVHPQRIAERIAEARRAGLLDIVGGGHRGRVAQYVAVIPDAHWIPDSGTQSDANRYGPAVRISGTHSRGSKPHCVPDSGTHNARALEDATKPRTRNALATAVTSHAPKDLSDEDVTRRTALAAVLPVPRDEAVEQSRTSA